MKTVLIHGFKASIIHLCTTAMSLVRFHRDALARDFIAKIKPLRCDLLIFSTKRSLALVHHDSPQFLMPRTGNKHSWELD
jgi:hypothetical protein